MIAGYSFRPRLWPWVLAAIACAGAVALGNWQHGRAEEKRALGAQFHETLRGPALPISSSTAKETVGRKVAATGVLIAERTVLLDNKIHAGRRGYLVGPPTTPPRLRPRISAKPGWMAAGAARCAFPRRRPRPDAPM